MVTESSHRNVIFCFVPNTALLNLDFSEIIPFIIIYRYFRDKQYLIYSRKKNVSCLVTKTFKQLLFHCSIMSALSYHGYH